MTTRKQDKQAIYRRPTNEQARTREWLEIPEIERLMTAAAKLGRHGRRDRTMILMAFRHGLRVAELVDLQWTDVNFLGRKIFIRRLKNSNDTMHHLERDEIAALRRLGGDQVGFIFLAEGGGPMCSSGFFKVIRRAGLEAGLPLKLHLHMFRAICGYALANKNVNLRFIQHWLGHRSIANTVRYTALSPMRYAKAGLWKSGGSAPLPVHAAPLLAPGTASPEPLSPPHRTLVPGRLRRSQAVPARASEARRESGGAVPSRDPPDLLPAVGVWCDRPGRDWWSEIQLEHKPHVDDADTLVWLHDDGRASPWRVKDPLRVWYKNPRAVRQHESERPKRCGVNQLSQVLSSHFAPPFARSCSCTILRARIAMLVPT